MTMIKISYAQSHSSLFRKEAVVNITVGGKWRLCVCVCVWLCLCVWINCVTPHTNTHTQTGTQTHVLNYCARAKDAGLCTLLAW